MKLRHAGVPWLEADMTRLTIRIDFDEARSLGHGKIHLIELIDRHGSISAAARAMDMSYRRAWLLVDEVNQTFAEPVIESQTGGKGGGFAKLTVFGRALVHIYRTIEKESLDIFGKRLAELEARLRPLAELEKTELPG
jgi:molybdate transport system regulatory protein